MLFYSYLESSTFIASDAISNPAAEGTKETLPGAGLSFSSDDVGLSGASSDHSTLREVIPLFFSSLLITLARGHTEVL